MIIYLLTVALAMGAYLGASIERGDKLDVADVLSMGALAFLWPLVLAAFAYVRLKEKL